MNTAIRALTAPLHFAFPAFFNTRPKFSIWLLAFLVMLSGFSTVYMSDINRRMVTALEDAQTHKLYLETQWDRLLLERSTWSSQSRVQEIASASFGMITPDPTSVTTINLRG
ncbi:MAG: ftsL [Gammaproteobacteria bacterium]|jgi:cell division protein FtsL|nr:ftsL [Gammaproteobacteria bacterium]